MCQTQYGLKSGDFKFKVDRKLKGGETLDIGGLSWEVLHIPGHSAGSVALYDRVQKVLIPGDVVYADYAIGRFDLHGADGGALKGLCSGLRNWKWRFFCPGITGWSKGSSPATLETQQSSGRLIWDEEVPKE